jgi:hypothetical protein
MLDAQQEFRSSGSRVAVLHWKWARERKQKGQPHGLPFHLVRPAGRIHLEV